MIKTFFIKLIILALFGIAFMGILRIADKTKHVVSYDYKQSTGARAHGD